MALTVLVTGAAGVLGGRIVADLRGRGHRVIACGRAPGAGVDAVWDLDRQEAPQPHCRPDWVVHAAAALGPFLGRLEGAGEMLDTNLAGTLRLTHWALAQGVEGLVLTSGALVYGRWDDGPRRECDSVQPWLAGAYAMSKWGAERLAELARLAGVRLTVLRYSSLYGPGYDRGLPQRLLRQGLQSGRILVSPPLEDAFDLLHVSDAARVVQRVLAQGGQGLWNVGGGGLTTLGQLSRLCAKVSGAGLEVTEAAPPRAARTLNWVDDSLARRELGHQNLVDLPEGLAQIAAGL